MRLGTADIPDGLTKAQEEGRLVVFAGAGVSMAPPTCAPGLDKLVDEIAANTGLARDDGEPYPDFLGRLKSLGIDVHAKARKILATHNQQPSQLHEAILRLFPTRDSVKIVTTNFDTLFTTACTGVFGKGCITSYCAPRPPLEAAFGGIMYLHGSLDEPASLILTAEDYGRAYLLDDDGWSSRFLRRLFREYTVLFIGYSHGDLLVRYMELGLRPEIGGGRFAFVPSTDVAFWKSLGIVPITYPPDPQHAALHEMLTLWGDVLDQDYLKHERRIKAIVTQDPPGTGDDLHYIDLVLRHRTLVQFFARHADGPKWLKFVEERQLLAPLFKFGMQVEEISQRLAYWFAQKYVCRFPVEALGLAGRNSQSMSFALWSAVLRELWIGKPRAEPVVLASWVVILLQSPYELAGHELEYILHDCRHPEDDPTTLVLFDYLTQPWLTVRKPWFPVPTDGNQPTRMDWDIRLRGYSHFLNEVWDQRLRPNLDVFAESLSPIVEGNLRRIYRLLNSVGKITDEWDPISWGRQRIWEDHSRSEDGADILITIMRHIVDWTTDHESERALAISNDWWHSGMMIFKRLGMYGISRSPNLTPEQKADWLLDQRVLYEMELKSDVFHYLHLVYPQLTTKARTRLLEVAGAGPDGYRNGMSENTFRYETYNLLYWIHNADQADALAEECFRAAQEEDPEFEPRKYPDLDHWTEVGAYVPPPPPRNVEELLREDPASGVDFLLAYGGSVSHPLRSGRSELLREVSQAVSRSLEWGWGLADALARREEWESDLWDQILQGWEKAHLTTNDWRGILKFLLRDDIQLHTRAGLVASFLNRIVSREQNRMPTNCIPMAEYLAERVWLACGDDASDCCLRDETWYITASQHPGGMLTEFFVWALSHRRQRAGDKWKGIPTRQRRFISRAVHGDTAVAEMSCVILGRHLYFLHYTDAPWTASEIIPHFNWLAGEHHAELFWQGFLSQNRLGDALFLQLLPYYSQSMRRAATWSDLPRKMFANHIAGAAMYLGRNPVEEGWLLEFIREMEAVDRKEWASVVLQILMIWESETIERTWSAWLREYWHARLDGKPVPLDPQESEVMLNWVLYLDPVFEEAVSLACKSPSPDEMQSFVLWQLGEKDYAARYPQAVADLLLHLMKNAMVLYDCDRVEQMVRNLASQDVDRQDLRRICIELARLGCRTARELGDLVEQ